MSVIVLVTADQQIRDQVQRCARRSGVHVAVHDGLEESLPAWPDADLVLLGADHIKAATMVDLPKRAHLDVVTASAADDALFDLAAEVGACYIVGLPAGAEWLILQFDELPDHPVARLRDAGFHVGYADRDQVQRYQGLSGREVHPYSYGDAECPFVTLDEIARSECSHGQSTTVVRSNYRALRKALPDVFVDVRYSNVDALGAVVADLTPQLVDTLIGLREQYPLFDEMDHCELEEEDITQSWSGWVSQELFGRVREHTQDVWVAMPGCQVEELFWEVVAGLGYRPVHDGQEIHWDLDLLAGPFAARLMAEFRRT